ncbi:MAG: hypothetical protein HY422_03245 [Candidatus Komeilibacteria bacterium]|nr:hypothetical protein [Candidatus Komeilibacteria bacterium]
MRFCRSHLGVVISAVVFLVVLTLLTSSVHAVGSGGILNFVPQATVTITDSSGKSRSMECRVYVHPLEGSLLVVEQGSSVAIALDRYLQRTISMAMNAIVVSPNEDQVDVPEHVPFTVLHNPPRFERTKASVILDDGATLTIQVKR